jgi:hypothetical protein
MQLGGIVMIQDVFKAFEVEEIGSMVHPGAPVWRRRCPD